MPPSRARREQLLPTLDGVWTCIRLRSVTVPRASHDCMLTSGLGTAAQEVVPGPTHEGRVLTAAQPSFVHSFPLIAGVAHVAKSQKTPGTAKELESAHSITVRNPIPRTVAHPRG